MDIDTVKKLLVQNATRVEGVPPDNQLLISVDGVLYAVNKKDERALCMAGFVGLGNLHLFED